MKLTSDNYYQPESDKAFWSASTWREFSACPSAFVARLNGEYKKPTSKAMLVGSYVDRALLTPDKLQSWIEEHGDDLFCGKDGATPTADLRRGLQMVEVARKSEDFMRLLSGDHQAIVEFELFGWPWKAMLDVADEPSSTLVDLKTTAELTAEDWSGAIRRYRPWYDEYIPQLAVYREAFRAKYGSYPQNIALAVVTRQDPPALGVIDFARCVPRMEQAIRGIESEIKWRSAVRAGEMPPPSINAKGLPCDCPLCRTKGVLRYEAIEE